MSRWGVAWRALLDHRRRLPRWFRALLGLVCVVAGVVLVARPFTSLTALVVLVAVAAIATGAVRWSAARRTAERLDDAVAAGWVVLGVAVLAWPELSVRGVAVFVGVAMVAGGAADLAGGLRGTVDERLASVLKGVASAVFGILALAWPDVTLLVVAVVFGARTVLFGLSELLVALRGRRDGDPRPAEPPGPARRWIGIGAAGVGLVAALVLAGVSVWLHDSSPTLDEFYDPPADLPDEPGTLVRAEDFPRRIPDGATAWRILYTTTRDDGVPATASGIVVAPSSRAGGPPPVIAWAHGTTGIARNCAPSVLVEPFESGAFFALDQVLERGWALVATDYVGLGTPGPHPYLVGPAESRSVLDAVRAAHQIEGLELGGQTVVWGHSQGGGAALWSGQMASVYAPDLDIVAVAAMAPAADLPNLADRLYDSVGGSLFASYAVSAYAATYPDVSFDVYVRPAARTVVRRLASRCLGEPAVLVSVLASVTTDMSAFRSDLRGGALGRRLAENVPRGPFEMPLLIGQGEADGLVTADVVAAFAEGLCAGGALVDYRTYPGEDHISVVAADSPLVAELLTWTADRLAGERAAGSC